AAISAAVTSMPPLCPRPHRERHPAAAGGPSRQGWPILGIYQVNTRHLPRGSAMPDQRDASPPPRVLVARTGSPVPAGAPAAEEVYSFWGYTPHFQIYLAESLLGLGVPLAEAVAEGCEADYERLRHYFGGLTPGDLPFSVYIKPGSDGASHSSCGDTGLYCDAFDASDGVLTRYLVVAEAEEVFEHSLGRG